MSQIQRCMKIWGNLENLQEKIMIEGLLLTYVDDLGRAMQKKVSFFCVD